MPKGNEEAGGVAYWKDVGKVSNKQPGEAAQSEQKQQMFSLCQAKFETGLKKTKTKTETKHDTHCSCQNCFKMPKIVIKREEGLLPRTQNNS